MFKFPSKNGTSHGINGPLLRFESKSTFDFLSQMALAVFFFLSSLEERKFLNTLITQPISQGRIISGDPSPITSF